MNKITESLIKSRLKIVYASCLHIFRLFGQKSDGAICTNDLISASLEK